MIACFSPGAMGLLSPIKKLLDDNQISEILINRPEEVFFEKEGRLKYIDVPELTERHLLNLFQLISSESEQILNEEHPLLSSSLSDGSRVQLVLPPTSLFPTLSIRRKVVQNFILNDYEKSGFFNYASQFLLKNELINLPEEEQLLVKLYRHKNWLEFIKKSIEFKKTMVISGGTSSGKTTFLNACLHYINHDQRIIVLEDTREIEIPHSNQVRLLASK